METTIIWWRQWWGFVPTAGLSVDGGRPAILILLNSPGLSASSPTCLLSLGWGTRLGCPCLQKASALCSPFVLWTWPACGMGLWLGSPEAGPEMWTRVQVLCPKTLSGEAEWGRPGRRGAKWSKYMGSTAAKLRRIPRRNPGGQTATQPPWRLPSAPSPVSHPVSHPVGHGTARAGQRVAEPPRRARQHLHGWGRLPSKGSGCGLLWAPFTAAGGWAHPLAKGTCPPASSLCQDEPAVSGWATVSNPEETRGRTRTRKRGPSSCSALLQPSIDRV